MDRRYDRTGTAISDEAWKAKWADEQYRNLARTDVGEWTVGAWWAGVDDTGDAGGRIFRSALLVQRRQGGQGSTLLGEWRHRTAEEALAHHDELVARLGRDEAVQLPAPAEAAPGCHCH